MAVRCEYINARQKSMGLNYMLNKQYNPHFNNEQDIHMSFKSYKENYCMPNLDLLIISMKSMFHIL